MHNNFCHTHHQRVIKPITTPKSYKLTKVFIMKVLIILNTSNYTNTISLLTRYMQYTWLNSNAHYIANMKCLIVIHYIYTACTCLVKWLWTPHIQHTPSLNCYHLVDATELWAPERPDTGTVSFPKQSISWTLDIKRGTQHYYTLFIHHTYLFFHFKCAHVRPHT